MCSGSKRTSVPESVTARLDPLRDDRGVVEEGDETGRRIGRLGHLRHRVLQVHDARADRGNRVLGHDERVAVAVVEADRDVARELDVLALVVAHGHLVGVVGEDVGRLQDRIVEHPDAHRLLAGGLLLELGHPAQLAERGDAVQYPGELGVGRHVALDEECAAGRVEPGGEEDRGRTAGPVGEAGRVVGHRDGVQVDDAVDRVVVVLSLHPMAHGPQVVAEMHLAGRLDAREDPGHRGRVQGATRAGPSDTLVASWPTRSTPPSTKAPSTSCCT